MKRKKQPRKPKAPAKRRTPVARRKTGISKTERALVSARKSATKLREQAKDHGTQVIVGAALVGAGVGYAREKKKENGDPLLPAKLMTKEGEADSGYSTVAILAVAAGGAVAYSRTTNGVAQGAAAGLVALAAAELAGDATKDAA